LIEKTNQKPFPIGVQRVNCFYHSQPSTLPNFTGLLGI
jgi:hypothetical protein